MKFDIENSLFFRLTNYLHDDSAVVNISKHVVLETRSNNSFEFFCFFLLFINNSYLSLTVSLFVTYNKCIVRNYYIYIVKFLKYNNLSRSQGKHSRRLVGENIIKHLKALCQNIIQLFIVVMSCSITYTRTIHNYFKNVTALKAYQKIF